MKGPTTDGIDITNKITGGEGFDFDSLIHEVDEVSNAHREEAIETQKQKVRNIKGNASVVVIENKTATRLKLEYNNNAYGHLTEDSEVPKYIDPGCNGAFAHVAKEAHLCSGSGMQLMYEILIYDAETKGWKSSGKNIGFTFVTGPTGKLSYDKFNTPQKHEIMGSNTIYDGQKITATARPLDDTKAAHAFHNFKIVQERGAGEMKVAHAIRVATETVGGGIVKAGGEVVKGVGKVIPHGSDAKEEGDTAPMDESS